MLLDLDLFVPNDAGNSGENQNSMLDQIQALRAMGYLNTPVAPPSQPANTMVLPPQDTEDDIRE